jgi:hypothetical protein
MKVEDLFETKGTKAEAGYQPGPKNGQKCINCTMWRDPNKCSAVAGNIKPEGWCKWYAGGAYGKRGKKVDESLSILSQWKNDEPAGYVKQLTKFFKNPDELTHMRAVWYNKDGFKRIEVLDEFILHSSPLPHYDYVYSYVDLKVPHNLSDELAKSSESILIDHLKGEIGARCASLSANAVTLQYVMDVVEGNIKPSKVEYEKRIKSMKKMFADGKRFKLDWWPDVTGDTDPKNKYYKESNSSNNTPVYKEDRTIKPALKDISEIGMSGNIPQDIDFTKDNQNTAYLKTFQETPYTVGGFPVYHRYANQEHTFHIMKETPEGLNILADMTLSPYKNGYYESSVRFSKELRGRSLASQLYALAITKYKIKIISDNQQTPGSKKLWYELVSNHPSIFTYIVDEYEETIRPATAENFHEAYLGDDEDIRLLASPTRIRKPLGEDGRIVRGVNTTVDVGPNEIKIQSAKFGNRVDKDGNPPSLRTDGKVTEETYTLREWAAIQGGHTIESMPKKYRLFDWNKY